jgi:LPXTG-motif cell wall-anchored protein
MFMVLALVLVLIPTAAFADGGSTGATGTTAGKNGNLANNNGNPASKNNTPASSGDTQPAQSGEKKPASQDKTGGQTGQPSQNDNTSKNDNTGKSDNQNSGKEQDKNAVQINVQAMVGPVNDQGNQFELYIPIALLENAENVSGKWTAEVVGGKKVEKTGDMLDDVTLPLGSASHYTVNIEFTGQADGKDIDVKKTLEINIPNVNFSYKTENGHYVFTATLEGANSANGDWFMAYGYGDVEEIADMAKKHGNDTTFSHDFGQIKPGKYVATVIFMGEVDGVFMVVGKDLTFEVKDNGQVVVTPPKGDGKGKGKGGTVVLNPKKGKDIVNHAKKGGKLPKTATTYPVGAAAGLVLLAGGLVMLRLRRTA